MTQLLVDPAWKARELPVAFTGMYITAGLEPPRAFEHGQLFALVSRDEIAPTDWRWHISVRYGDPGENGRVPLWEELVETGHALRPGVPFVVGVPPRSWWINVHPHVLHLYETRDHALVEQWRTERRGDRPS
jgi:hypothetical protein